MIGGFDVRRYKNPLNELKLILTKPSDIFKVEIIIPSKMNYLTLRELEYLYPDKTIPKYPKGLTRKQNGSFVAQREIKGKKHYIGTSTDISEVLMEQERFCSEHKITNK